MGRPEGSMGLAVLVGVLATASAGDWAEADVGSGTYAVVRAPAPGEVPTRVTEVLASGAVTGLMSGDGPAGLAAAPDAPWEEVRQRALSLVPTEDLRFIGQRADGTPVNIDVQAVTSLPPGACRFALGPDGATLDGQPVTRDEAEKRLSACPVVAASAPGASWGAWVAAIDAVAALREDAPLLQIETTPALPVRVHVSDVDTRQLVLPQTPPDLDLSTGVVECRLLVTLDATGAVTSVELVPGQCAAAVRDAVVTAARATTWHPYRSGGEAVPVQFVLPFRFTR